MKKSSPSSSSGPTPVTTMGRRGKSAAKAPPPASSTFSSTSSSSSPDQLLSSIQGDVNNVTVAWPTMLIRKMFRCHGEFCASQPWEVIVATFMFLVCFLTVANKRSIDNREEDEDCFAQDTTTIKNQILPEAECSGKPSGDLPSSPFSNATSTYTLFILAMSCLSILRVALHFHKIHAIGSNLVWKIALTYLCFTYILFALVVWSLDGPAEANRMKDCWFLIPLFTDMSKVTRMAQFALSSSHYRRISEKVANGMHVLAPTFFLDTVAWTLFSTLGFLTGIQEVTMFAKYTVVALLVNFFVYVSFYPAALSLVLELMFCSDGRPRWDVKQIIYTLPKEEGQSPNSHRVRVIVIAITSILHIYLRPSSGLYNAIAEDESLFTYNYEKITFVTCVICVTVYYLFNSEIDEAREMRTAYIAELTREFVEEETFPPAGEEPSGNSGTTKGNKSRGAEDLDPSSNSTDEGISLSGEVKKRISATNRGNSGSLPGIDDSSSESTWSEVAFLPDLKDQEVQTTDSVTSSEDEDPFPCSAASSSTVRTESSKMISGSSNTTNAASQKATTTNTSSSSNPSCDPRSLEECLRIKNADHGGGVLALTDKEIVQLVAARYIRSHALESILQNASRAVDIRRRIVEMESGVSLSELPFRNYDFERVQNACCESVLGYMPIPVGKAGPLFLDGREFHVPMATTEGCLIASVNRGCRALREHGVRSYVYGDGMTRGPIVRFDDVGAMTQCVEWLARRENFDDIKNHFDSTSRFARLQELKCRPAGRELYIRFKARTGDAMGMNMLSKATEHALRRLKEVFPRMQVISLSGNFCTDKKPAAINWLDGRGKSVCCDAIVSAKVVSEVLKTTPDRLVDLNRAKNLVGSAQAGSIGGFNAQAANVVTAIFIATGQDAAQNVASSNCITQMETHGEDLYVTVTMPSIEVGTVGGGTILAAQANCLEMLGVRGSHPTSPGENSKQLARIVASTVLAGELSLMSALAEGHLVKSHLRHNRSVLSMSATADVMASREK